MSGARRGFVLIAALAALLIGALWAARAADRLAAAARGGRLVDAASQEHAKAQDALAGVIFLATTAPRSPCGLQPRAPYVASDFTGGGPDLDAPCLRLDDRAEVIAGAVVRLQDAGGLISVRAPNEQFARPFLAAQGAQDEAGPSIDLVQTLRDFGDLNEEPLPYGAEARSYRQAGKPAPPNRWPRTPYDAFDALGWENAATPAVADRLGLAASSRLNINTAPADLIGALAPFDRNDAAALAAARERFGFNGLEAVREASGGRQPEDPFILTYLPSSTVRARIAPTGAAGFFEASITLYPADSERLWSLDYVVTAPQRTDDGDGHDQSGGVSPNQSNGDGSWLEP